MPARRPYASRGVPRRATTYPSGGWSGQNGVAGLAALVAVLVVVGVGFIWLLDPALLRLPATLVFNAVQPGDARASNGAVAAQVADAPDATTEGAPVLQMAKVAAPAGATAVSADATPTSVPTLREWESNPAGLVTDPVLVGRLDQALVGVDGHISLAVKDLGSGRGAALDGDREMPAASLYKLTVLYSVFEAGLGMGEELPVTEEARSYDAGTMELGAGETLSVAEALERMVTISDNTAAVMLGSRVGAGRITANNAALGMDTTHYSLERMTTSALDMLHLLDVVAQGKAVSPAASADMVHLLLRQRVNDRLPRLLPEDVQIAHKTGNLPGTVNDVGIVYGPTSTVAIAVLISDTTDETMAATAVARVGQTAYAYFGDEAEVPGRPTIPRAPARAIPPVWRQPNPPTPTPTPIAEPTAAPEPSPIQGAQPTSASVGAQPATPAPTAGRTPAPTIAAAIPAAPIQAAPTATPAAHAAAAATPTPTPPPPSPPTRAPTRVPAPAPVPAATPTPGHH